MAHPSLFNCVRGGYVLFIIACDCICLNRPLFFFSSLLNHYLLDLQIEEGMNPREVSDLLRDGVVETSRDIDFIGFPDPDRVSIILGQLDSIYNCLSFSLWYRRTLLTMNLT